MTLHINIKCEICYIYMTAGYIMGMEIYQQNIVHPTSVFQHPTKKGYIIFDP